MAELFTSTPEIVARVSRYLKARDEKSLRQEITKLAPLILPTVVVNDETTPVPMIQIGRTPVASTGATVAVPDNVGGYTVKEQKFYSVQWSELAGASEQLFTVTAGKKAYLTFLTVSTNNVGGFKLRDATADGGTTKFYFISQASSSYVFPLPVPIEWTNGMRFDAGDQTAGCTYYVNMTYFEE